MNFDFKPHEMSILLFRITLSEKHGYTFPATNNFTYFCILYIYISKIKRIRQKKSEVLKILLKHLITWIFVINLNYLFSKDEFMIKFYQNMDKLRQVCWPNSLHLRYKT